MLVADKEISTVGIIDDDPDARQNYMWTLEDAHFFPAQESGPLNDLKTCVDSLFKRVDAVLCDHHLRQKNYAHFNGAELAAKLYDKGVPAVLCTRWEQASFDELRKYRPKLPSLLRPDDLDAESLLRSFEAVIRELAGEFAVQRRPWRTQVHVVEVAKQEPTPVFYIDLPSWPEKEIIRLLLSDLPTRMQDILEDDKRLHAMVNLGAETAADLYFIEWEES